MNTELQERFERWRSRCTAAAGSLKLRITLAAVGALVLGIGLTCAVLLHQAERDTLSAQGNREMVEAVRTAAALTKRVVDLQRALRATANLLDAQTLADDARLATFMDSQPVLRGMFANLFAATADGRMRVFAEAAGLRRPDLDLSGRAYFQRTIAEQRAIISDIVPGRISGEPVIVFTYPLLADGRIYGVLGGALRLKSRDLLGDLTDAADTDGDGESDGVALVVVTDDRGRVLAHPSPQRLMQPLASEPRLAQAFADWVAAGSSVEPAGLRLQQANELVSASGVVGPDWMVWRAMPQAELLAPLHAARRQSLIWACGLIAVMSLAMLALLRWLLRPLTLLEHRAQTLFDGSRDPQVGWPVAGGEIGRLGRVLRHVSSERAQLEAFNAQVLQKLGSVMDAAPVGICFTRQQRFELVSAEFCRLFGRAESELVGQSVRLIYACDEDYDAASARVATAFAAGPSYEGEWQLMRADGERFWASLRGAPVDVDEPGAGTIWTLNDIGGQVAVRAQLEWSATHDGLTGLANRKALDSRLALVFAALPRSVPAALVMIDLDHFKPINDSAGHAAGDAVLCAVAHAITACVRVSDLVVRLGGDEFALLLERCAPDVALRIAENVCASINELAVPWEQRSLTVGASLGMAVLAAETRDAATWLGAADAACYQAKAQGRGKVRIAPRALAGVLPVREAAVVGALRAELQPNRVR